MSQLVSNPDDEAHRLETSFTETVDKSKKKAEEDEQYEPVSLSQVVSTMVVCQVDLATWQRNPAHTD